MKSTKVRIVVAAAAAVLVSGCALVIDEGTAFAPQPFDPALAASSGETIRGETILKGADPNWRWAFGSGGDKGELRGDPATFAAATIQHGRQPAGGGEVAWSLLTRPGADRPLIVFCGGNASTRQNSGFVYSAISLPYGDVLLFDYPGSGETGGVASAETFEGLLTGLIPLIEEKAKGRSLVVWGHSLGGFVCSELTERVPGVDGVVLEATARNAEEVAAALKPWFLGPFLQTRVKPSLASYDNVDALKAFDGPILVLGAENDQTLPVRLSRSLQAALAAIGRKSTYVEIPDSGHNSLAAAPEFAPAVAAFFARVPREK